MFKKVAGLGRYGNIFKSILALYNNVECCVNVLLNGFNTDWFEVNCGLKQGCCLSTLFFDLFINDLVTVVNTLNVNINVGSEKVAIMLYADDLVLLAESEQDLQLILNEVHEWCKRNKLNINRGKSNVVHFRAPSVQRSSFEFYCGDKLLKTVSQYTFLGLLLTEHLDYDLTAKNVAKAANRALGLILAKDKAFGGLPFRSFTKLFDTVVWSVINYGAGIWGTNQYSCINAIQTRAERYFLGIGKYTPNAAVRGETAWTPAIVKQWGTVANVWCRLKTMDSNRLNYKIFKWSYNVSGNGCKNWCFKVVTKLREINLINQIDNPNRDIVKNAVISSLLDQYKSDWIQDINPESAIRGFGRNKLRTYRLFKTEFKTESYLYCPMTRAHRRSYARFRCGVAPLRLETGRYEGLAESERVCFNCEGAIENEEHVL